MSLHLCVEAGKEVVLEELIRHRVRGPTYHPDVECRQRLSGLIGRCGGLHRDGGTQGQPGLGVLVGGVVRLDVHLREAVVVLRLPAEGVAERVLQLLTELGRELGELSRRPEVVDQVFALLREFDLERLEDPQIPVESGLSEINPARRALL